MFERKRYHVTQHAISELLMRFPRGTQLSQFQIIAISEAIQQAHHNN